MKKGVFVGVVVIIVVIVAIGAYFLTRPAVTEAPEMKVALVMPGAKDDISWNEMAYNGLRAIEEKGYETAFSEWVPPPDAERYIRDYADLGYDVIFVHDFLMADALFGVAEDYPDISFVWSGGFYGYWPEPAPNVYSWQVMTHEGGYLVGLLATGMSDSDIIGIVNAYPVPTLCAAAEGFKQGVEAYNEKHGTDVRMVEIYTYDWEDALAAKEAAISEIEAGADVIFGSGDSMVFGVSEACKEREVWQIGGIGDQHTLSPETILTSLVWRIDTVFVDMLDKIVEGTASSTTTYEYGLEVGGVELAPYYGLEEEIPTDLRDEIEQATEDIIAGTIEVEWITEITPV